MTVDTRNSDLNPQGTVQGTSYIYNFGASPNTRAAMSQKVRILTTPYGGNGPSAIGVLGNFSPSQSRSSEPIRGIGFGDVIAELVPAVQEPVTVQMERTLLYLSNLWQALGYAGGVSGPVRALCHHRWPFDLEQQVVFSEIADRELEEPNGIRNGFKAGIQGIDFPAVTQPNNQMEGGRHNAMITMYEACWLQDTSFAFTKDAQVINESGSAMCTSVHDFASTYGEFMRTGNDPYQDGPGAGSIRFQNSATDTARRNQSISPILPG
jgi:hypothetical protein